MKHEALIQQCQYEGMDGAKGIPAQVLDLGQQLEELGYVVAGDGVDAAIAIAVIDSDGSMDQLRDHLDYQIKQLQLFRAGLPS